MVDVARRDFLAGAGIEQREQIADLDVPDVPEFMEMLHEMGVTMWACRMSVDMMDLDMDDFFEGVEDVISAGDFMSSAS